MEGRKKRQLGLSGGKNSPFGIVLKGETRETASAFLSPALCDNLRRGNLQHIQRCSEVSGGVRISLKDLN